MASGNTPPRKPLPPRPAGSMHRLKDTPPPQVSGSVPMTPPFQPANLILPQANNIQRAVPPVIPKQMAPAPFLQDQGPAMSFREQHPYFAPSPLPDGVTSAIKKADAVRGVNRFRDANPYRPIFGNE